MGMAQQEKRISHGEMIHASYPNLNHCKNCDAVYKKSKHWVKGYSDEGTQGAFYPVSKVPENSCPVCLKSESIEQNYKGELK